MRAAHGGPPCGGRPPPLRPVAPARRPGLKRYAARSPPRHGRHAARGGRRPFMRIGWLAPPRRWPRGAAAGGWPGGCAACAVAGLRRQFAGRPGDGVSAAPTSARGRWGRPLAGCGPPCGGGQPWPACVRPLRLFSRHSWRGPQPSPPRGGPRRPSWSPRRGPPGGAFRRRLRPVPLHGVGRRGIAAPWDAMRPTP